MSFPIRLSLALISLVLPFAAAAAAPGNVTGIKASMQNGKVLVVWTPVTDQHIANYRVFFSHASILQQNGLYDDYETVDGTVNSYVIPNTPPVDTLYVSVLAANDQQEESPYFAEEASVNIQSGETTKSTTTVVPQTTTSTSNAAPLLMPNIATSSSAQAAPTDVTTNAPTQTTTPTSVLQLIGVQTLSATGVQLTFSQMVVVDSANAATAFTIKTGSGKTLPLTRLIIKGNTIVINTMPQERGTVYAVIINGGVSGKDPTGAPIVLDPAQAPMLFTGSPLGVAPAVDASSSSSTADTTPPTITTADITGLSLHAQAEGNGLYTVHATWQIPSSTTLSGFQVFQTVNNGGTYSQGATLNSTTNGVNIPHVPSGTYGLLVRSVFADGSVSHGTSQSISLPKIQSGTSTSTADVLHHPRTSTHLPQTGPGLILALLMAGSISGYAFMKRKVVAQA